MRQAIKHFTTGILASIILIIILQPAVASSTFTLSIATEDGELASPGNPHYIASSIEVKAYTPGDQSVVFGPQTKTTNPSGPADEVGAYEDFWPIPTETIVRYENSASGYVSDFDEIYLSAGISSAYESLQNTFHEDKNGFETDCQLNLDSNSWPYYLCSVIDDYGTSTTFYYYRPYDPGTDEIYDLAIVTNKLFPEEEEQCTDEDNDGFAVEGGACGPVDCNDNDPDIYPGAEEICDGLDNDCDGQVDEDGVCDPSCTDDDQDGYNAEGGACGPVDCDDSNPFVNPGMSETCDGLDNDCDGQVDEGGVCSDITYHCDVDEDGFNSASPSGSCDSFGCVPAGCTTFPGDDCNDNDPDIYPGAEEICDGLDNDCDGQVDEGNVCGSGVISVSIAPGIAFDDDNLTCTVDVNNLYDEDQDTDLTVDYDVTGSITASGDFICTDGVCSQDLLIDGADTAPEEYLVCSASFTYEGNTYSADAQRYIHPKGQPTPPDKDESEDHHVLEQMRFVEDNEAEKGQELKLNIFLDNKGIDIKHAKAHVLLLGMSNPTHRRFTVGPFDLDEGDDLFTSIRIPISEETESGMYYARITIGDGDYRTVKHCVFFVE